MRISVMFKSFNDFQELAAIKSKLESLTREVERLRNVSHRTLKCKVT